MDRVEFFLVASFMKSKASKNLHHKSTSLKKCNVEKKIAERIFINIFDSTSTSI